MLKYKVIGITDERDSCDCCGKVGLERTVALEDLDSGETVFFGTTCAARAQGWTVTAMQAAIRRADDAKRAAKAEERRQRQQTELGRWEDFLGQAAGVYRQDGKVDAFACIEKLGGYEAATAAYEASV